MHRLLFRILGSRVALLLGSISFLSVSVLSSLFMTAGYSLEAYVSSQMDELPWDATTLQKHSLESYGRLSEEYRELEYVQRSEVLGILRLQRDNGVVGITIDDKPLPARWIVLVATTDPELLPPILRSKSSSSYVAGEQGRHSHSPRIVTPAALLTASGTNAGFAPVDQGSEIEMRVLEERQTTGHHHGSDQEHHSHGPSTHTHTSSGEDSIFLSIIEKTPAQLKRREFNKRMLANLGSISFLPKDALVLSVPMDVFEDIAPKLDSLFVSVEGVHGDGVATLPYLPELTHYIDLNKDYFLESWELGSSIRNLLPHLKELMIVARDMSSSSYVNSDASRVLSRMAAVSRSVGFVTLLIALPLLLLVWVVSKSLCNLFLQNERRLIGLVLIRGLSLRKVVSNLWIGGVGGCLTGGVLGLIVGLGAPIILHSYYDQPLPPPSFFSTSLVYFVVFLSVGCGVAIAAGGRLARRVGAMTPREAVERAENSSSDKDTHRYSKLRAAGVLVALGLGSYKVCAWIAGRSLIFPVLRGSVSESNLQIIMFIESLLNFVAVPLFLFGIVGLLSWYPAGIRRILKVLSMLLVGRLNWFVDTHMKLGWHRVVSIILLTSLALSMVLLPQIAADTFYDRVSRGVDTSLGADIQITFDLSDLADGRSGPATIATFDRVVRDRLSEIESILEALPGVSSVAELQEYNIPGFYLPNQDALVLSLIRDPDDYLQTVRYEEQLGLTNSFSQIVQSLEGEFLASSRGLMRVRNVPLNSDIILGRTDEEAPITAQITDVVSLFPGQSSMSVSQREGFAAAEADYLNYLVRSDARVFSTIDQVSESSLARLEVVPSRALMLVRTAGLGDDYAALADLVQDLPVRPDTVLWREQERLKIKDDMFVSLALGNMHILMLGGLVLALAGVYALNLASYRAEKRTLSLLRLRGMPLADILMISLSMFLVPVIVGAALGVLLGMVSGFGISQAIWELPRIYGVAEALENQLAVTHTAALIIILFCTALTLVAVGFGLWTYRRTARDAIMEH